MTPTSLQTAQEAMTQRIYAYAREMKLSSDALSHELCMNGDTIDAIPDGVYSAERYLKARKRIMWVLKEPYDEISELGYPCGGGWQVSEAFDAPGAWKNPTWQSMIYATYGILNNKHWKDMDWISDDRSMADCLKDIAYINISKMPGYTASDDAYIEKCYDIWRPILLEQIRMYEPEIIVFGNTFRFFKHDLVGDAAAPCHSDSNGKCCYLNHYKSADMLLLDAYHPNQRMVTREVYVESIIKAGVD